MAHEARAFANLLLDIGDEMRLPLTHMALHKVAYYAHGWRLAEQNRPLIAEHFEAWEHGPVLPSIYREFKGMGRGVVTRRATRLDLVTHTRTVARAAASTQERLFLRDILKAYGRLDALTLSDMTHRAGGPWDRVWNAPKGRITLGMKIENAAIRSDFVKHGDAAAVGSSAGFVA